MGRENGDLGSLARHDMHGVVDAFSVALCEFVVAAKVIGGSPFCHRYSLQPIVALLPALSTSIPIRIIPTPAPPAQQSPPTCHTRLPASVARLHKRHHGVSA